MALQHLVEEVRVHFGLTQGVEELRSVSPTSPWTATSRWVRRPRWAASLSTCAVRTAGQERVVREVGAEQDQQVGFVDGVVACAVAEETAHADVEGVVELDPFLAPQGVADRCLDGLGERHHVAVGCRERRRRRTG